MAIQSYTDRINRMQHIQKLISAYYPKSDGKGDNKKARPGFGPIRGGFAAGTPGASGIMGGYAAGLGGSVPGSYWGERSKTWYKDWDKTYAPFQQDRMEIPLVSDAVNLARSLFFGNSPTKKAIRAMSLSNSLLPPSVLSQYRARTNAMPDGDQKSKNLWMAGQVEGLQNKNMIQQAETDISLHGSFFNSQWDRSVQSSKRSFIDILRGASTTPNQIDNVANAFHMGRESHFIRHDLPTHPSNFDSYMNSDGSIFDVGTPLWDRNWRLIYSGWIQRLAAIKNVIKPSFQNVFGPIRGGFADGTPGAADAPTPMVGVDGRTGRWGTDWWRAWLEGGIHPMRIQAKDTKTYSFPWGKAVIDVDQLKNMPFTPDELNAEVTRILGFAPEGFTGPGSKPLEIHFTGFDNMPEGNVGQANEGNRLVLGIDSYGNPKLNNPAYKSEYVDDLTHEIGHLVSSSNAKKGLIGKLTPGLYQRLASVLHDFFVARKTSVTPNWRRSASSGYGRENVMENYAEHFTRWVKSAGVTDAITHSEISNSGKRNPNIAATVANMAKNEGWRIPGAPSDPKANSKLKIPASVTAMDNKFGGSKKMKGIAGIVSDIATMWATGNLNIATLGSSVFMNLLTMLPGIGGGLAKVAGIAATLLGGGSIDRTLAGILGSGVGEFIGGMLPIPFVGGWVGSLVGGLIGDWVYTNFIANKYQKATQGFVMAGGKGIFNVDKKLYKNITGGRALGGSVFPGNAYIVGERGPEIMLPSSLGSIVPNHKLRGPGGMAVGGMGGTINASVVINNPQVSSNADIDRLAAKVSEAQTRALRAAGYVRPR